MYNGVYAMIEAELKYAKIVDGASKKAGNNFLSFLH